MSNRMRMYLQVGMGLTFLATFITGIAISSNNCEDAVHSRGDTVTHRLTGERAIVASSFCSGSGPGRHRAYAVSTGREVGGESTYWGQFEITH